MESSFYDYPWVLLRLKKEMYGVAAPYVQTMVAMPEVTAIPHRPKWSRGVVNLRGQIIPIIDLRRRLGMDSFLDNINELVDLMHQREQDHRNWLEELQNSVREERSFALATDPHKCKFGQWYDSYKPRTLTEAQFLQKFAEPHERIHGIAIHVQELRAQKKQSEAMDMIKRTRNCDLVEMIRLFDQFRTMIRELRYTEIALVIENLDKKIGMAVDSIESVEMLENDSAEELPDTLQQRGNNLAQYVARRKKTGEILYLLNAQAIIEENISH